MPAEHLRALIQELHPGVSVRQLTEAAGLSESRISYYLRPSTAVDVMPPPAAMKDIARAIGCDLIDVVEAFAADVGLPWGPDQSFEGNLKRLARVVGVDLDVIEDVVNEEEVRRLLRTRRRIPAEQRHTLVLMAQSLAGGPPPEPRGRDRRPRQPPRPRESEPSMPRPRKVTPSPVSDPDRDRSH